MAYQLTNLSLPEWAWLQGGDHEKGGDPLYGRNVVLHVRSASVIEFLEEDKYKPAPDVRMLSFRYKNSYGLTERYVAVLHYSAACDDPDTLDEILHKAARWYCSWISWEDGNIDRDNALAFN